MRRQPSSASNAAICAAARPWTVRHHHRNMGASPTRCPHRRSSSCLDRQRADRSISRRTAHAACASVPQSTWLEQTPLRAPWMPPASFGIVDAGAAGDERGVLQQLAVQRQVGLDALDDHFRQARRACAPARLLAVRRRRRSTLPISGVGSWRHEVSWRRASRRARRGRWRMVAVIKSPVGNEGEGPALMRHRDMCSPDGCVALSVLQ